MLETTKVANQSRRTSFSLFGPLNNLFFENSDGNDLLNMRRFNSGISRNRRNFSCEQFVKGDSDPNHFIFEINVGKGRIRHTTTLKLN